MIQIQFNKEIKIEVLTQSLLILNFKEIWLNFLELMIRHKCKDQIRIELIHQDKIIILNKIIKINMHNRDINNNNKEIIRMTNNSNKI